MRFLPRSLLGQTLLAVALALLVAQAVSAYLLYVGAMERRQERLIFPATLSLVGDVGERQAIGNFRRLFRTEEKKLREKRPLRGELTNEFPLLPGESSDTQWEEEIRQGLLPHGIAPHRIVATVRSAVDDPILQRRMADWQPQAREMVHLGNPRIFVAAMQVEEGGPWRVVRLRYPRIEWRGIILIAAYSAGLFFLLMAVLYFLLRRITRPLATLTERTERFALDQNAGDPLTPSGPDDIQRLQVAHNAMEQRIAALLDEKDVMLGAIGHDLKTPLTALRVRIESVENEAQRAKMAAGIEDITRSLDDILSLARIGRAKVPPEAAQLGALVESVVEEFEDLGEPVTVLAGEKIVLPVQVTWLRRALRNLISNALRYGGSAEVSLLRAGDRIVLRVDDNGPGIPPDQVATMLEPFQRGEASRNRATGGAGLGLTLARAIAEQHGGELVLANRPEGGLRAEIRLPAA